LRKAHAASPWSQWVLGGLGHACARSGQADEAREILGRMQERARTHSVSPYLMAYVSVGLGEHELAFRQLEQACEERTDALIFAKVDPVMDPLRGDPRFAQVLNRLGL
jgi:hypothetical protein